MLGSPRIFHKEIWTCWKTQMDANQQEFHFTIYTLWPIHNLVKWHPLLEWPIIHIPGVNHVTCSKNGHAAGVAILNTEEHGEIWRLASR